MSQLLNIDRDNVDVFSVQLRRVHPPLTDVRFAAHGSLYYKPVRLNGIVLMHREEVNIICNIVCKEKISNKFLNDIDYLVIFNRLRKTWVSI